MHRIRFRSDRPVLAIAALVVAAGLLAAGCSSDSEPTSSEPEGTTTTADAAVTSTTRVPIDPATLNDGAKGYEQALVPLIVTYVSELSGKEDEKTAKCLAPKWVKTIGVEGFADAGFAPADVAAEDFNLGELGLTTKQATTLYQDFGKCDVDLRKAAVAQIVGQSGFPDEVADCLDDAMTDEFVEMGFVTSVTGGEVPEKEFAPMQECIGN